jgi:hypothetical protein
MTEGVTEARLAQGSVRPHTVAGIALEVGITTGGGLGRAEHPGGGWRLAAGGGCAGRNSPGDAEIEAVRLPWAP